MVLSTKRLLLVLVVVFLVSFDDYCCHAFSSSSSSSSTSTSSKTSSKSVFPITTLVSVEKTQLAILDGGEWNSVQAILREEEKNLPSIDKKDKETTTTSQIFLKVQSTDI